MYENAQGYPPVTVNTDGNNKNQDWLWAWLIGSGAWGGGAFGGRGRYGGYGGDGAGYAQLHTAVNQREFDGVMASLNGLRADLTANRAATENSETRAAIRQIQDLFVSLNNQGELASCNRFHELSRQIQDCCCSLRRDICDVKFEMSQGFAGVNTAICSQTQTLQHQAETNTRDIIGAIHSEGEQTRALINANTLDETRDKLAAAERKLESQSIISSITTQCGCCPGEGNGHGGHRRP